MQSHTYFKMIICARRTIRIMKRKSHFVDRHTVASIVHICMFMVHVFMCLWTIIIHSCFSFYSNNKKKKNFKSVPNTVNFTIKYCNWMHRKLSEHMWHACKYYFSPDVSIESQLKENVRVWKCIYKILVFGVHEMNCSR